MHTGVTVSTVVERATGIVRVYFRLVIEKVIIKKHFMFGNKMCDL